MADLLNHPEGTTAAPGMVEVLISDPSELEIALAEAIEVVSEAATNHSLGIMVTRVGIGSYVVRAHPEVPFGLIRQRHK
ncbi:hypothetical protein FBY31_0249 [Arthrobacter sp. SLBN-100]|uniref:hypothetical protein n=1 Tax=Arthrobacter sp. SLBN-100 TaxID=2768450 RepID=UPI00114F3150|nr:hypothetical protein [Arthrobacter sp. SLBN-100]TQJ66249.1 hypothetical protein FBY31_0249 [Arthrobacter sp. SLBN-100]